MKMVEKLLLIGWFFFFIVGIVSLGISKQISILSFVIAIMLGIMYWINPYYKKQINDGNVGKNL